MPNVPRLRRLPVLGSFFREYKRYSPDFSFRIIAFSNHRYCQIIALSNPRFSSPGSFKTRARYTRCISFRFHLVLPDQVRELEHPDFLAARRVLGLEAVRVQPDCEMFSAYRFQLSPILRTKRHSVKLGIKSESGQPRTTSKPVKLQSPGKGRRVQSLP